MQAAVKVPGSMSLCVSIVTTRSWMARELDPDPVRPALGGVVAV